MDLDSALSGKPAEGASATDILRADHREVERLFADFERAGGDYHAARVAARAACLQLELHDIIEKEVFYPAVFELDPKRVEHVRAAHADIERCVEDVRKRADADEPLDETLARLKGLVQSHVREEESGLFPQVEKSDLSDLRTLGLALIERKEQLTGSTRSFEAPAT